MTPVTIKIGKKYGRRTVLKRVSVPSHIKRKAGSYWLTKCDCGNYSTVTAGRLKRNPGCRKCVNRGKIGESSFHSLFLRYKAAARYNGRAFSLNKKYFRYLTKQNCKYCGLPPSRIFTSQGCYGGYTYTGIDRINNKFGYTVKNSVPCCKQCNYAKHSSTHEDFINWLKRIFEFQRKQKI